jgi:hypothetical protein
VGSTDVVTINIGKQQLVTCKLQISCHSSDFISYPHGFLFFHFIKVIIITESYLNQIFIMYIWDVYLIVCLFAFRLIFLRVRLSSSPRSDSLYCPNPFVISRTFKKTLLSWHTKEQVKPYAERGVHSYISIRTFPKVYVRG